MLFFALVCGIPCSDFFAQSISRVHIKSDQIEEGAVLALKRVAVRQCVGCGRRRPKNEMIRISKTKEGRIQVDPTGTGPGRGCYICYEEDCLMKSRKKGLIARALRAEIPDKFFDDVLANVKKRG